MEISYNRVREFFKYDDGNLIWRKSKGRSKEGSTAGMVRQDGYRVIGIDTKVYLAHRLIYLYHKGYFPENGLDHKNRIKDKNEIDNLREASKMCNARNSKNRCDNTSGVKGVCFDKARGKWASRINILNKAYSLGRNKDFDEAVLLRLAAEQCLGWESCDESSPAYEYAVKNKLITELLR